MFSLAELSRYRSLSLQRSTVRWIIVRVFAISGWTFLFAVIYAQSPLYTSNQNQYFLHGLANASFGFLKNDWLANTLDPTPLFSLLVSLTYTVFNTDIIFYIYYAILLGIYLFTLLGAGSLLYDLNQPETWLVYLALLLVLHSAGMRFFLSRALGPEWAYVLEGGLAGQRVLGVVFQPSTFGVLLVLSIYLFIKGHSYIAVFFLALAASFHPTYLLTAGIITLGYMVESFREKRNLAKSLLIGALALLLVSPTLSYVFTAFGSTPAETTSQARDVLVYFRIPHHAVISEWFDITSVFQIALILAATYLVRRTRLFTVMAVSILAAASLTFLQIARQDEALALLFPWRISTILVPLSVAILSAALVSNAFERFSSLKNSRGPALTLASTVIILLVTVVGATRTILERQIIQSNEERDLMGFIESEKKPEDVYLVPIKLQDFRLETGAPVYVDFKSIPYRDVEVLEWYRRIQLATDLYDQSRIDCGLVDAFAAEGVTNLVIHVDETTISCDSVHLEYLDEQFGVYSIPR
jgi:hypothetical protein